MSIIGKTISETRRKKGLTQEELAELSKVNLRTIQRIENNNNQPRTTTLNLICVALDIELEQLLKLDKQKSSMSLGAIIIGGFYLVLLNLGINLIFTYLTIDSKANMNSRFAAVLLSFLIPFVIVYFTPKMKPTKRTLRFGLGFLIIFMMQFIAQGFPEGLYLGTSSGLTLCHIIAIWVLYYGANLLYSANQN